MFIVSGYSALSKFAHKRLLQILQSKLPMVTNLTATYQHFIKKEHNFTEQQLEILETVLSYGENKPSTPVSANTSSFLVIPRIGTISPWSSKATDILHNCGLTMINRVERGILYTLSVDKQLEDHELLLAKEMLHDRMIEVTIDDMSTAEQLFVETKKQELITINILKDRQKALVDIKNKFALTDDDIEYLYDQYSKLEKNPTDVELMMYSQINSEHCRHKIFNANFILDDKLQTNSLFDMIKHTHNTIPANTLSAYKDNAAVIRGYTIKRFYSDPETNIYSYTLEDTHLLLKVETHNHPTAISPTEGAATGAGGEIRDEGATGRGAKPKFGLTGYSVSNLQIPGFMQDWEQPYGKPDHISSAFDIMQHAPIGSAAFNNEFGRPNLLGYFRTYEQKLQTALNEEVKGYHKPIMIAGGLGVIKAEHVQKNTVKPESCIVVLGGPALEVGLGGGTASSSVTTDTQVELDFASVQRYNPEMARRCQEVIDKCWKLGSDNPIEFIHDVGAGGLSNAIPELLEDNNLGGILDLRSIISEDHTMSPLALWCNEAQERYVVAIDKHNIDKFKEICSRERCPMAVIGVTTEERQLIIEDSQNKNKPVNIPMDLLFKKNFKLNINAKTVMYNLPNLDLSAIELTAAIKQVLHLPVVASKNFLITISDRSITGLVYNDQMVGPWQVPVADCAVTAASFMGYNGDAMSMGERAPIALIDAAASARIAVAEAITNIAATNIGDITNIKLSANWMSAANHPGEYANLFNAVATLGMNFCTELGVSIPVGKDSLSMQCKWQEEKTTKEVTSPLSVVISACAPIKDIRKSITPELKTNIADTELLFIDLGEGKNRLGASALAQVYNQLGNEVPDVTAERLKHFFMVIQLLINQQLILAYHDKSDGGLLACVSEMAFAGRTGVDLNLEANNATPIEILFNEELGAVIQIKTQDKEKVSALFSGFSMTDLLHDVGTLNDTHLLNINYKNKTIYSESILKLQSYWAATSYKMQSMRDNADCAKEEYNQIFNTQDKGLFAKLTFNPDKQPNIHIKSNTQPKIAILREQGVNGQIEMAAAFEATGFCAVDVHMSDLLADRYNLLDFNGLVACGGFSYGDVLGAGGGWAKSILFNNKMVDMFSAFFQKEDTFTLGVCNGCQMLSQIKTLISGAEDWPIFTNNKSEQFEARVCMVEITNNHSIFFDDMIGSQMPITVAHKQGRAVVQSTDQLQRLTDNSQIAMQYIDRQGSPTEIYPLNPNGSELAIAGLTSKDGRVTIMMPHPERVFRTVQHSWHPDNWNENAPFMRMFYNAKNWVSA